MALYPGVLDSGGNQFPVHQDVCLREIRGLRLAPFPRAVAHGGRTSRARFSGQTLGHEEPSEQISLAESRKRGT